MRVHEFHGSSSVLAVLATFLNSDSSDLNLMGTRKKMSFLFGKKYLTKNVLVVISLLVVRLLFIMLPRY